MLQVPRLTKVGPGRKRLLQRQNRPITSCRRGQNIQLDFTSNTTLTFPARNNLRRSPPPLPSDSLFTSREAFDCFAARVSQLGSLSPSHLVAGQHLSVGPSWFSGPSLHE